MEAAAGVTNASDEFAFDERMDVFITVLVADEFRVAGALLENVLQSALDAFGIGRREHAGARQTCRPRAAAAHVVFKQPAIESERRAPREQFRVGVAGKTS